MLSMMLIGTNDDEEAFETKPFNKSTNTAHETSHVELSTDLEGIKLDMVISEFKLNKRYETYTSEIGQLREEMLNSRSLVNDMQNQIKVLNNTLEKAQERNGSARQDLKKEIAGIRNWSSLWKMLAKFTSNPQIMQVKRSYLEYSQLNSASALKIVYDKGMVENHCGKDKRQVLWESEIYSRKIKTITIPLYVIITEIRIYLR